ncbi:transcription factor [Apiospora marii]|uniref:Transcription factor n=1 Tax=Apiospora marii TaxID=335849 RepID=A0ABR1RY74_9PEZI
MHYPIRSCVSCKTRRVRCDRQQPSCGNCSRARGLGQDCVYPTGRGRAPKRRRNSHGPTVDAQQQQQQIADRLARLERMIRGAGRQDQVEIAPDTATRNIEPNVDTVLDEPLGRLKVTETNSHYLHDVMWDSLADEVEELRDLLLGDGVESDEVTSTPFQNGSMETASAPDPSALLFGLDAPVGSLRDTYPTLVQAATLFAAFCENVAPVMRVMHLPTLTQQYWNAAASPDKMDRNTATLVSAINYAAVATMSNEQCLTDLGQPHQNSLTHYRTAAEQALSHAHLLSTRSPTVLQAALLYTEALKNEKAAPSQSAAVRSLAVLAHHLARSMGLHRDGAAFGLPPFEAEMRRRLWWYVCILDHRTAEACGDEHAVRPGSGDARMPLHVDDADLSPGMVVLPAEREGFAEMTFCLVRYETLRAVWRMDDDPSLAGKQAAISELESRLEDRYLRHCDPEIPFQLKVLLSARMMLKRLWFVAHWPSREKHNIPHAQQGETIGTATNGGATRDQLFTAAVDLLESAAGILAIPALAPWTWHAQTYSHWHAVAFVLHELRRRPPSAPECERAWRYVCVVCEGWLAGGGSTATDLARPIRGLWEKVLWEREGRDGDDASKRGHIGAVPSGGDGGEENQHNNLSESVVDMFPPESGGLGDFSYSLMADHDMSEYFHFEENDLLGTLGTESTS